jgi:hypothetical protein
MNLCMRVIAVSLCLGSFSISIWPAQSPYKGNPYPNELPNLKIYESAKWKSLTPYTSTVEDVKQLLGKAKPVYDELLKTYVAGYEDPDWTIVVNVVAENAGLPASVFGRILTVELHPNKRLSLVGADFSAFRSATYAGSDGSFTSYYDKFGLRYVVYEEDSADGRFKAGDLKRIDYGPSDENTEKFSTKTSNNRN